MARFDCVQDIAASVETVWSIITDSSQWQLWFPDVTSASSLGTLRTGTAFQWQNGDTVGTGHISFVTPERMLELEMEMGGKRTTHTFQVSRHGGLFGSGHGSQLRYTLELHSPSGMNGELLASGNPIALARARQTAEKVKELAERVASHP